MAAHRLRGCLPWPKFAQALRAFPRYNSLQIICFGSSATPSFFATTVYILTAFLLLSGVLQPLLADALGESDGRVHGYVHVEVFPDSRAACEI